MIEFNGGEKNHLIAFSQNMYATNEMSIKVNPIIGKYNYS